MTPLVFWTMSAHYWLMLSFSSAITPESFSTVWLSVTSPPNMQVCLGLPQSGHRTSHFALLSFMRFTPAHLSSVSGSLWRASLPSRVLNYCDAVVCDSGPLCFVSCYLCRYEGHGDVSAMSPPTQDEPWLDFSQKTRQRVLP